MNAQIKELVMYELYVEKYGTTPKLESAIKEITGIVARTCKYFRKKYEEQKDYNYLLKEYQLKYRYEFRKLFHDPESVSFETLCYLIKWFKRECRLYPHWNSYKHELLRDQDILSSRRITMLAEWWAKK